MLQRKLNLAINSSLCYILIKEAINFFLNKKFPRDAALSCERFFFLMEISLKCFIFDKIFVILNV